MTITVYAKGLTVEVFDNAIVDPPPPPPPPPGSLSTLAAGRVRDLGAYGNPNVFSGSSISDDSGIVCDPDRNQVIFGLGGHGGNNETSPRRLDLATMQFSSLYPPMPYASMLLSDWDMDYGRWRSNNHPGCRHTYNSQVIVGTRYYCLQSQAMPFLPNGSPDATKFDTSTWGGRIFWHDLVDGTRGYSQMPRNATPWYADVAVQYDKQLKQNICAGTDRSASGFLYVWLHDPTADAVAPHSIYPPSGPSAHVIGQGGDLVYVRGQNLYYIVQGRTGEVWTLALNRSNPMASVLTKLTVTGAPSQKYKTVPGSLNRAPTGFGYDEANGIIGGYVGGGDFSAFNVNTRAWSVVPMLNEDGSAATVTQACASLDFDVNSGCFIFLSSPGPEGNAHAFAYRFKA